MTFAPYVIPVPATEIIRCRHAAAFGAVQRCPDIDVLVPRRAGCRQGVCTGCQERPFPVAIDASGAARFIDLRPGSDQSYLTHRRLRFPVPSDLFAPQPAWLAGVEITTIDPTP